MTGTPGIWGGGGEKTSVGLYEVGEEWRKLLPKAVERDTELLPDGGLKLWPATAPNVLPVLSVHRSRLAFVVVSGATV